MSTGLLLAFLLFAAAAALAGVIGAWRQALSSPAEALQPDPGQEPDVTVVVPARDEEGGIALLLQDLHAQRYPKERLEVIVVDDASSDRTAGLARGMQRAWPQLKVVPNAGEGKKAAISTGVAAARGELIVLTDADGRCGPGRIAAIAAHWRVRRSALVVAPVWTAGHGMLGALQELEQAALLGAALGSAAAGRPFLAYGANLAFTRAAFLAVGGYHGDRYASGDDVLLLQRLRQLRMPVSAILSPEALVTVDAEHGWGAFVRQRLRWAGKMRAGGLATIVGGLLGLLLPWALLWATLRFDFVRSMGGHALYAAALLGTAWLCWLTPIIGLVGDAHRLFGRRARPMATLLALAAFSVYAPLVALLAQVVRPKWKGRRVRS